MSEEIKEILDKLNKTADNPLFVICSSQKELDKIPKYTANFLSVNDRQAKLLLNYITNLQQKVEEKDKEIDRLNNIIDTMLEFSFFKEECPLNFGFGDEKEEKAQDVFYEDDYCEENCNDIYKKCWLKYFEKLQELKENNK